MLTNIHVARSMAEETPSSFHSIRGNTTFFRHWILMPGAFSLSRDCCAAMLIILPVISPDGGPLCWWFLAQDLHFTSQARRSPQDGIAQAQQDFPARDRQSRVQAIKGTILIGINTEGSTFPDKCGCIGSAPPTNDDSRGHLSPKPER
jgi:hypothetical protein